MRCIQLPDIARMLEMVKSRKFGTRNELRLSLHGARPWMTGIGSVGGKADEVGAAVKGILKCSVVWSYVWMEVWATVVRTP
jgi:hypothetical protein